MMSRVRVLGNDDAIGLITERLSRVKRDDILSFAQAFYDEVDTADGGVLISWALENIGAKWAYLEDDLGGGNFTVASAWHPPKEFFVHLFRLASAVDPSVVVEVDYEDEAYEPIGAIVIKRDEDGVDMIYQDEDDEFEEPDGDDDDERQEFLESVVDRLGEMVRFCQEMIDEGDGEPIDG